MGWSRERVGRRDKRTSVVGLVCPLPAPPAPANCLLNASTHDISPLGRNGIFQVQILCLSKGSRLKISFSGQPEKKMKLH